MNLIEHSFSGRVAGALASVRGVLFGPVEAEAAFQEYVDKALGLLGIQADETERLVMAGVWSVYEPGMELLRDADLDEAQPEPRADLSAPPPR
jgi:hypothetical protein